MGTLHNIESVPGQQALKIWALSGAQLGGVATPLSHPRILPQAMTMCQWLLRMLWDWELQQHVQHKLSVSYTVTTLIFSRLTQDTVFKSN